MVKEETDLSLSKDNSTELLKWTTHPIKRKPIVAVLVTLFILVIPFFVLSITSSKLFGFLSLVVLFASVAKFYFPTYFTLTDTEVVVKSSTMTNRRKWTEFRSYYPDKNGVLLSPFVDKSRLENFRGIYIMFDNNSETVLAIVKQKIAMDSGEVA